MNLRDSLHFLRRKLLIVVAVALLGGVAGWMSAPGEKSRREPMFEATHTLIYQAAAQGRQGYTIQQVALMATSGTVPSRVAERLQADRTELRTAVSAEADAKVGAISITGRSADPARAVSIAEATAEELKAELDGRDRNVYETELTRLTTEVQTARTRLAGSKVAEQTAARIQLEAAERALREFQSEGAPKSLLRTLETTAAEAVGPEGVQAPSSKPVRAGLLGFIGLLVGAAGAFLAHRLDAGIHSKRAAEAAFDAPVIAEVPRLRKSWQGQLLIRKQPTSSFVEAYRALRTYLALWAPEKQKDDDGHRVIVVTSAGAGEGKTTSVAHLAAMLAEIGRSVVVISADLRRPRIHEYFDRSGSPGLVDILAGKAGALTFDDLDLGTSVRGVQLIPSGPAIENPAPLLEHAGDLLHAVRGLADFVLVDTPPLLVANDAVDLARHADGVLLVTRAGGTTIEAAQHSAEMLKRLDLPVVGVVLVGSESASSSSYYSARYYREPERTSWRRRRPAGGEKGQHARPPLPAAPEERPTAAAPEEVPSVPAETTEAELSPAAISGR
ncbi:MAG TPA: P-loop NTPase [Acidimicrobiia bacterium]|nr:P-loop NTPase [Acidimicrobiia bacterium]